MWEFLSKLFDPSGFPPRWQCGAWTPAHGWLHILSDLGIWSAYLAIPLVLGYFVLRKKDMPFRTIFLLFGAFILACGTTHLMEAIIFWWPAYRLAGVIKLFAAIVSWATVIALVPVTPRALAMRSPEELEREIEERKRTEVILRQSEERFRFLVEGTTDYAIYLLDLRGNVVSWNSGAERIKGYRADEIIGVNFACFYPREAVERGMPEQELAVARSEGRYEEEGWRVRKNGSRFWASVVLTALRDEHEGLKGFSKITRDLTERKLAEERLRDANAELEVRVRERTAELEHANEALEAEIGVRGRVEEELRRQARDLQESEARFRQLADAMPQIVWQSRPDGYLDYYNERWYEFTGQLRGRGGDESWEPVLHPDDVQKSKAVWHEAVRTGKPYHIEYRLMDHRDGEYRWHLGRALPVRDEAGRIVRWFGTCTDINDQKRAEESLRRSEAQFRTLADSMPQLAWTARPDGDVFWYNRRWYDYTGKTPGQMEGWGWQSVHDPNELPKVLERWQASIATGEPFDMVFPLRGADGEFRPFLTLVMPLKDERGQVLQWFGTNTDITQHRDMERALRRAQEELEGRVRERTAALASANQALEVRARQQAAVAHFGQQALAGTDLATLNNEAAITAANALGVEYSRVMELLPDRGSLLLRASVGWGDSCIGKATVELGLGSLNGFTLLANKPVVCTDWQDEARFRRPKLLIDHGVVSSMAVVVPGSERPYGVLGVDATRRRDFTEDDKHFLLAVAHVLATAIERKQAEERAAAFAAELQRSNQELEQFASLASHDLQEPLRKIQAFGDRLQARFSEPLGEQGRQYIERMQASATRMRLLIEDLLTYSRVASKTRPFVDVDLAAMARHVVSDLEGRIQQTGGRVEVAELPTVQADATQMRQLLQNLLANALKFHRPGQSPVVRIGAEVLHGPDAQVNSGVPGGMICRLTVEDNGIGFEEEYRDQIFQLFRRLHGRNEYEGTGIGLAVCKKIVERHGGTIAARSTPGRGATFIITLPLRQSEGATSA